VPFEELAGNAAALDRLRGILASGRRAHAYLFSGPEGVGKRLAALDFAQALAAQVLFVSVPEDKHEIGIPQVHEVIRALALSSDRPRVVLIDDAHRMSDEAMNAILKTLEEPPPGTTLILVTHVPDRMLGTIRSRCQSILFFALDDETLAAHAAKKLLVDRERARVVAVLAGGSPGAAAQIAADLDGTIARARDLQARVMSGELNAVIEALGKIKDTEDARAAAKRDLGLLAQACREALRARAGHAAVLATPAFLEHLKKLDEDDLLARIETLLDHGRMIDLNANVALCVEDALLRV
jgi:DNA polymerase-3 subunit delta'